MPEKTESFTPGYATPKSSAMGIIITSTLAFIASFSLVIERLQLFEDSRHVGSCDFGGIFSCTSVMKTPQAALFGFPNPLLGIVGFAITLTIGVVMFTGAKLPRWFLICTFIGISLAFIFIIWLWYNSLYKIGVLCPYCIVVWFSVIPLFFIMLKLIVYDKIISLGKTLNSLINNWTWLIVLVALVVLIFSIIFAFINEIAAMVR